MCLDAVVASVLGFKLRLKQVRVSGFGMLSNSARREKLCSRESQVQWKMIEIMG